MEKRGQVGYSVSVLLVFIGFMFFGIFLMQSSYLTGGVITEPSLNESCEPSWTDCEEWQPVTCPISRVQTRGCRDLNKCVDEVRSETRSCEYKINLGGLFILVVFVIGVLILAIILWIVSLVRGEKSAEPGNVPSVGMQPPKPSVPPAQVPKIQPRRIPPSVVRHASMPTPVSSYPSQKNVFSPRKPL